MAGFDTSSLRPANVAGAAPVAPPKLDTSKLRPAIDGPSQAQPQDDLVLQTGAGIVTGLPNMVTGTADLLEKGVVDNLLFQNPATGENQLAAVIREWGNVFTGKPEGTGAPVKPKPYKPFSGNLIKSGLDAAHLDPNDYFPEPKSAGERIARLGGEGAVTALISPNKGAGLAKLLQMGKDIIAGGVGGASAQTAMEVAPDEWDIAAGLAAGLGGGIFAYGAIEGASAGVRAIGNAKDSLRPVFARDATGMAPEAAAETTTGRLAAERLAGYAEDPTAAAAAIESAPELVPRSRPTSGQASGDRGLMAFERALARNDQKFKAALLDRMDEQNEARVAALDSIEASGDVGAAAQFFRDRMRTLEQHAETLYNRAEAAAQGQYDALGDRAAGDIGDQARNAISARLRSMSKEASVLWESIDPDGTLSVATKPLVESAAKIYGEMSPEERLSLSASEKNIYDIIGGYGDALEFSRFKDLRSEITRAMREAKSFANPNDRAHRRLSMLRDAIEKSVEKSVTDEFQANPSLAEEFAARAREWYANRPAAAAEAAAVETGPSPVAGDVDPAARGQAPVLSARGAESYPPSGPRGAPSDQGLPEDVGKSEDVSGGVLPAEEPAPRPVGEAGEAPAIEQLDPREIGVDARRFQFKEGGDEKGVTERLQGVERWDPRLAGTVLVFRDAQGKNWVADGHQRTGLARRLIENGHPPFKLNAFVLDAAEGITDADARAIAAVKNIAEGTGSPVDAAKVLRAAKETGIDLPPLPPRSTLVKDGIALADLSPDAFGMVINEVIPAAYGAIVGRMVKDGPAQEEALRVIAAAKPDNARQVEMIVRDMLNSGIETQTRQGGLFGAEAFASSVVLERAKIADQALKLLKQDKRLFATLVDEAERIEGAGNALNRDANQTRLSTDEKAADLLTQLAFRAGPTSTELTRLARGLKNGEVTPNAAARDFLKVIRSEIESGVDQGDRTGGAGARPEGEEAPVTERDPDTIEMFQSAPPLGSAAFGRWFGKSKVVDESGQPMVVYHGSRSAIDVPGAHNPNAGIPMWFAEDKRLAETFIGGGRRNEARIGTRAGVGSNLTPAYLSVQKPIEISNFGDYLSLSEMLAKAGIKSHDEQLAALAKMEEWAAPKRKAPNPDWGPMTPMMGELGHSTQAFYRDPEFVLKQTQPAWRWVENRGLIEVFKGKGFDGIKTRERQLYNQGMSEGKRRMSAKDEFVTSTTWAPFDPGQVKSKFNRGTFDPTDPNIMHQSKKPPLWKPGDMLGEFETERGQEGFGQAVIPGTEVTDATRMAMRANKPLAGGNAPPPKGGLFDEAGREDTASQMSLFQSKTGSQIRDTMAERFAAAGRPAEEAVAAGEVIDAFYTTMAERLGVPVAKLMEQHPLPQVRQGGDGGQFSQAPKPETPAFKKWFGDSKVVDAKGKPLVVYHGTNQPIELFDIRRGGSSTGTNAGATKAIFFTSDAAEADQYARAAGRRVVSNVEAFEKERARLQREVAKHERAGDWDAYEAAMAKWEELETRAMQESETDGRNIIETYLSIKNPMEVDFGGGRITAERDLDTLIDEAKAAGHDGLILKNIEDSPEMGIVSTQYAVFDPTQVKSVDNRGTFDPSDPRILFQSRQFAESYAGQRQFEMDFSADPRSVTPSNGEATTAALSYRYDSLWPGQFRRERDGLPERPTTPANNPASRSIYRDIGGKKVQFDDEYQAELYSLGEALLRGGKVADLAPEIDRLSGVMGEFLDPPATTRTSFAEAAKELARTETVDARSGRTGSVIDPEKANVWNDFIARELRSRLGERLLFQPAHERVRELPTTEFEEFATGKPVTFDFERRKASATAERGVPEKGDQFGRDLEPSGRYMIRTERAGKPDPKIETGTVTFRNPLVINEANWKKTLSDAYGGLTGKRLSQAVIADGHDGIVTVHADDRPGRTHLSEIVDLTTFDAKRAMYQTARGAIEFGDTGSIISMFKDADPSTALHESGHHFLKMFKSMAEGPDAPETIVKDWNAAKAWWEKNAVHVAADAGEGVTPADVRAVLRNKSTGDRMKDLAIDRGLHEQWARGFESYLREGKAPNNALRGIFQQFKDWLTKVYRDALQLNVDLSPEIRGVFDRMLSTKPTRMMDRAAADRLSAATAATREIKDTFGAKPVKSILRRPGPTYPYDMSPESVSANLFKPGPEGAASIKNVLRAGAPKEAVEASAVLSMKKAATKDGRIDPAKLEQWRNKHAEALREVPDLNAKFSSAAKASEAFTTIAEKRKQVIDEIERSAVGKLLKVRDDADVAAVLGRMLGKDTAVRDMRSLVAEARRDPAAMSGLRRALVDYMLGRMKTPKDALRADTFQRFLGKNTPALQQVLTPDQMKSLRAIAADLKRASKDSRAPGGGSDTAENLAARNQFGMERPSILGQLVRRAMASGAVGIATHTFHGPFAGAISTIGSWLGAGVLQGLKDAGMKRVDDLVREAVLNPDLMKALLMKAPKRGDTGSALKLREKLANLATMTIAANLAASQDDDRAASAPN